jgi:hypothetical protein
MRRVGHTWMIGCIVAALSAGAVWAQPKNPYTRARADRLGRTLKTLHMGTLLEYLARETDDEGLMVDALLNQAAATTELAAKDKLLARAAELLKKRTQTLEQKLSEVAPDSEDAETALIDYYRARVRYIEVQVLQRAQPYIDRLAFLLAGEEDVKTLRELAGNGAKELAGLQKALEKQLEFNPSGNPEAMVYLVRALEEAMVYLVPELEDIQNRVRYNGAKVRYFAAAVEPKTEPEPEDPETEPKTEPEPEDPEKTRPNRRREILLEKALEDLKPFVENPDYGVQDAAYLFQGRCYRELGRFPQAADVLAKAAGASAESPILVEVLFEIARTQAEQGAAQLRAGQADEARLTLEAAEKAIETFTTQTPSLHPQVGVDFKKLILSYYLYENWADALRAAGQEAQAAEIDRKGQQAFVDFLNKYRDDTGIRMAAAKMFQRKLEGRNVDLTTMDPVIVGLLAELELNEARQVFGGRSPDQLSAEENAAVQEYFAKAKKLFEAIRASQAESAQLAVPDALWNLGVIYVYELDNFKAAERFRELVERFPEHVHARQAALNAVKIAEQLILLQMEENEPVSRQRRLQLVESIRLLLKHWPDDPQSAQYHAQLAGQCEQLAITAEDLEAWRKWTREAIAHYDRVPKDHPRYREAQFYGLELRWKLLDQMPAETDEQKQARLSAARELRKKLLEYGMAAQENWAQADDEGRKADLGQWGSTAEFRAELIGYEILDMQADALAKIEKLAARWPDTAILQESQEYLIRKLLAKGGVDKALTLFNGFRGKYGDEKAQDLMRVVVENLQRTIQTLVAEGKKPDELAQYRKAYLDFANQVYQAQIGGARGTEKYDITALLADALVQSGTEGNAQRALRLYEQLLKEDQARRQKRIQAIRSDIAKRMAAIDRAGTRMDAVEKLLEQFRQALRSYEIDPASWNSAALADLKYTTQELDNDESAMTRDERLAAVKQSAREAYRALQKELEQRLSIDARLLLGLARARQAVGQYGEALKLYRKLDAGLSPSAFPMMYWEVQLAIAQTTLAMHRDKPDQMKKLDILIEQLRDIDPNLGGRRFLGRFNKIQAQARKVHQQADKTP